MPDADDTSLLLAAGTGDRRAFGELVERHHRGVVRFVHRFLGIADRATAEDIAQDVFLAAWKAAPRFEPRAAVRTWLLRITTNTCLNHRRSRRRRPSVALTDQAIATYEGGGVDPPDAAVAQEEFSARLEAALAELPANQRAAIVLRHVHDLSYAEIADVLETSLSAVESLLFRARRRLGTILQDQKDLETPQDSAPGGAQ